MKIIARRIIGVILSYLVIVGLVKVIASHEENGKTIDLTWIESFQASGIFVLTIAIALALVILIIWCFTSSD